MKYTSVSNLEKNYQKKLKNGTLNTEEDRVKPNDYHGDRAYNYATNSKLAYQLALEKAGLNKNPSYVEAGNDTTTEPKFTSRFKSADNTSNVPTGYDRMTGNLEGKNYSNWFEDDSTLSLDESFDKAATEIQKAKLSIDETKALEEYSTLPEISRGYRKREIEDMFAQKGYSKEDLKKLAFYSKYINESVETRRQANMAYTNEKYNSKPIDVLGTTAQDWLGRNIASLEAITETVKKKTGGYADPELAINTNSKAYRFQNVNDAYMQANREKIEEEHGKAASVAYDVTNMAGENLTNAMMAGILGEAAAGAGVVADSQKASQVFGLAPFYALGQTEGLKDAQARGLTERQALTLSNIEGAVEVGTEYLPFENMQNIMFGDASKNMVKSVLRQVIAEGGEEAAADILDDMADAVISKDKSAYNLSIKNHMENDGMTEEEATKTAFMELVKEAAYDGVMGAATGGLGAGGAATFNVAATEYGARKANIKSEETLKSLNDKNSPNYISETESDYKTLEDYKNAQETKAKALTAYNDLRGNKRVTNAAAREIYRGTLDALESQNSVVRERAKNEVINEIKNASDISELETLKEAVSESEDKEIAQAIAVKTSEFRAAGATDADFENANTPNRVYEKAKSRKITDEEIEKLSPKLQYAANVGKYEADVSDMKKVSKFDATTALVDGKQTKLTSEVIKKGEDIYVKAKNGSEVKITSNESDHTLNDRGKLLFFGNTENGGTVNGLSSLGDAKLMSVALDVIQNTDIPMTSAISAIKKFNQLGRVGGITFEEAYNKSDVKSIRKAVSKKYLQAAFELNATEAKNSDIKKESGAFNKGTGEVTKAAKKALNKESKAQASLVETLAKKIGFTVDAKKLEKGNRAMYNAANDTVTFNSNDMTDAFASTFHEAFGEFMQKHNANDMKAIQDKVLNYLHSKLTTDEFNQLTDAYREAYLENAKEGSVDENKSYREAANEMVNDTLFALFTTEEGMNDLLNWSASEMNATERTDFLTKVKNFFDELMKYIENFLKTGSFNKAEQAALEMDLKTAKELRQMVLDAMDVAIANRDANVTENITDIVESKNDKYSKKVRPYSLSDLKNKEDMTIYSIDDFGFKTDFDRKERKSIINALRYNIKKYNEGTDLSAYELDNKYIGLVHAGSKSLKHVLRRKFNAETAESIAYLPLYFENSVPINEAEGRYNENKSYVLLGAYISNERTFFNRIIVNSFGDIEEIKTIYATLTKKEDGTEISALTSMLDPSSNLKVEQFLEIVKDYFPDELSVQIADELGFSQSESDIKNLRYSKKVDSTGRTLSEGQQEYFKDSKAVDEDGNLMKVYHGTVREFYEFDREYANPEGNMGSGFYFTSDEWDVERNYANEDGADLTSKIEQEADMLEYEDEYEGMEHDEIVEVLRKKYITSEDPITMECYLDIKNPCYVGSRNTYLFEDIDSDLDIDDYENEDEYYEARDYEISDFIDGLAWKIDNWDEVSDVVVDAIYSGGITLEDLKTQLAEKYTEDENGKLNSAEIARQLVEAAGYDGIIDDSVADKFKNMEINRGTKHYIIFNSNQAKLTTNENPTDNPDVRKSIKVDSEGKLLSEGQQEYFKDSKAVDKNGNLLLIYHGSNSKFSVFDAANAVSSFGKYKFNNANVNFFTSDKASAESYAKMDWKKSSILYEGYANVVNPYRFSANQKSSFAIENEELIKIEKSLINKVFDLLSGDISEDYASKYLNYLGMELRNNEGEYEIYKIGNNSAFGSDEYLGGASNISDAIEDAKEYYLEEYDEDKYFSTDNVVQLILGSNELLKTNYDGIIIDDIYDTASIFNSTYGTDVITIGESSQFKESSNLNPTENSDIRKSIKVDSTGKELTEGQQEYFKDSKVVDDNGNLMVMYHMSPNEFTVFDIKKASYAGHFGKGFYFSDSQLKQFGGVTYECYLNITNPISWNSGEVTFTEEQLRNFITALAENEDYGIENYGEGYEVDWLVEDFLGQDNYYVMNDLNATCVGDFVAAVKLFNEVNGTDFDGIIASTETVAFYPEQIKLTTNENPTEDVDIRKSKKVGYHAGDLGKAESFGSQYGSNRGTGHFGTGTYFVGNEEAVNIGGYKNRPKETVDFSKYNLLKPKNNSEAKKIHDALKVINSGNFTKEWIDLASQMKMFPYNAFNWRDELYAKYGSTTDGELGIEIPSEEARKTENQIEVIKSKLDEYGISYESQGKEDAEYYRDYLEETLKSGVDKLNKSYNKFFEAYEDLRYYVANFNDITEALKNTLDYMDEMKSKSTDVKYVSDSMSTYFMKQLGYEGVDVRHLPEYDNTQYGSVIYDLKDEDLARKNEIGTARFSLKVLDETSPYQDAYNQAEVVTSIMEKVDAEHTFSGKKLNKKYIESIKNNLLGKYNLSFDAAFIRELESDLKTFDEYMHNEDIDYKMMMDYAMQIADEVRTKSHYFAGGNDIENDLVISMDLIENYYKQVDKSASVVKEIETEKTHYQDRLKERYDTSVKNQTKKNLEKLMRENGGKSNDAMVKEANRIAKAQVKKRLNSAKESAEKAKQKDKVVRTCTRLINWMNHPQDKKHVPDFMKQPLGEMIAAIDFMPKSAMDENKYTKSAKSWHDSMVSLGKVLAEIQTLGDKGTDDVELMQKYALSCVMEADNLAYRLEDLKNINDGVIRLSDFDAYSMKELSIIMDGISHAIDSMNELYMNRRNEGLQELAQKSIDEMGSFKQRTNSSSNPFKKPLVHDFLNVNMLEPLTFFSEMGEASESIMQEFFDGEKIGIEIIRESENFFNDLHDELKVTNKDTNKWSEELHDFDVDGGQITLTTADIMGLYASKMTEDANKDTDNATYHIEAGGIKATTHKVGLKTINMNPKTVHPSLMQIDEIINTLTDTQKAYVDAVVEYMSTTLSTHGNETSQALYGYDKFTSKKYYPLKTDTNVKEVTEGTADTAQVAMRALLNPSFTKTRLNKADNALVVMDFFDVVTNHIMGMSNYSAYAMPVSDALRWYNFAPVTREGNAESWKRYDKSIKEAMTSLKGDKAKAYFENFLRDVNLDQSYRREESEIQNKFMGMYKAQAVAGNIRVAIQQPAAITRAMDVIENKYLLEGLAYASANPKKAMDEAQKKNYLCYWKSKGFSDTRISMNMKEVITGNVSIKDKVVEASGKLAGVADDYTWAAMYKACELKISKETNLSGEEYKDAVDDLFSEVVNKTQVIDSNLRKTAENRKKGALVRMANAFKNEPQKTYNMLHRKVYALQMAEGKEAINLAKAALKKTAAIYAYNALVTAIAQSIADAFRDDDEEKWFKKFLNAILPVEAVENIMAAYDEGTLSKDEFVAVLKDSGNFAENLNPLNLLPYVSDVISIFKGFDSTRMDTAFISQIFDTVNKLEGNGTPYQKIYSAAKSLAMITGIPVSNIVREVKVINNNFVAPFTGKKWYSSTTAKKSAEKKQLTNRLEPIYDSSDLKSIKNRMNELYQEKIDEGKSESDAYSAVRKELKAQYQRQLEAGESKATLRNRYTTLLGYTKRSDGKGGYRAMTSKEIANWFDSAEE